MYALVVVLLVNSDWFCLSRGLHFPGGKMIDALVAWDMEDDPEGTLS
jgi:hypothetical protein